MPQRRTNLLIVNPVSGRGRALRTAERIRSIGAERGVNVQIEHTKASGDAERIAREACAQAEPPDCITACGGDGTIQEIANVLAAIEDHEDTSAPTLGLAPAGRCNDFARALGIKTNPESIAEVLFDGEAKPIDLGSVNGRYFCTVATVGVDAEVSSFVDRMKLPLRGTPAYLYGAIRVLLTYKPKRLKVTGEFGTTEQLVFLASSANTSSYGGGIPIAPRALADDGLLDLCLIQGVSRFRAFMLFPKVLAGRHESLKEVRVLRGKRFEMESPEPIEFWADGERIGRTPAVIEVHPGAVRVMLPCVTKGVS